MLKTKNFNDEESPTARYLSCHLGIFCLLHVKIGVLLSELSLGVKFHVIPSVKKTILKPRLFRASHNESFDPLSSDCVLIGFFWTISLKALEEI